MKGLEKERIKSVLMAYLHHRNFHYEQVMFELFRMEIDQFQKMRSLGKGFTRNSRAENVWTMVFEDLASILTPLQLEQLVEQISTDFKAACELFNELAQCQKLLLADEGGQD